MRRRQSRSAGPRRSRPCPQHLLAFGPQPVQTASAPQQVTLTNTGSAALTITNIAVTGTNSSAFVFPNPCGASLAPGANCAITGHLTPATAGPMAATLSIADNASGSPQIDRP